jgi:hypothetical protein
MRCNYQQSYIQILPTLSSLRIDILCNALIIDLFVTLFYRVPVLENLVSIQYMSTISLLS